MPRPRGGGPMMGCAACGRAYRRAAGGGVVRVGPMVQAVVGVPVRTRPKAAFYEGLPRVAGERVPAGVMHNGGPARVHVFVGSVTPPAEAAGLRPDGVELSAARSASSGELEGLLPVLLARRIGQAVRADDAGSVAYLEDGRPVDWER